jgi:hypothetical protein
MSFFQDDVAKGYKTVAKDLYEQHWGAAKSISGPFRIARACHIAAETEHVTGRDVVASSYLGPSRETCGGEAEQPHLPPKSAAACGCGPAEELPNLLSRCAAAAKRLAHACCSMQRNEGETTRRSVVQMNSVCGDCINIEQPTGRARYKQT